MASDYNESTPRILTIATYADLDFNFVIHPTSKDLVVVKDISAVKNSVRNLVLTSFGERPFQPMLGSRLRSLLFENADAITAITIKQEIERCIKEYEKRINAVRVSVTDLSDQNAYSINVTFNTTYDRSENISFIINRLR